MRKVGWWFAMSLTVACTGAAGWAAVQVLESAGEGEAAAAPVTVTVAEPDEAPPARLVARPAMSPGGRFVAFTSQGADPVAGDREAPSAVLLYDRENEATRLVSVGADGFSAAQDSVNGDVSFRGRFVAFSTASALIPEDRNGAVDMYVRDVRARTTERVSVGSDGAEAPEGGFGTELSQDGRFAVFVTTARLSPRDLDDTADVYRHDRVKSRSRLVSGMRQHVGVPYVEMSDDGRAVTVSPSQGDASRLLVADLESGTTTPVTAEAD